MAYPTAGGSLTPTPKRLPAAPHGALPAPPPLDIDALLKAVQQAAPSNLGSKAQALAGRDVNATVAGIRAQQDAINQQASQRAGQDVQASLAAARYLQGLDLGGQSAQDFSNAAAAERAAAAGYSGGLQQTVGDAAAAVQRNLAAIGSPQQAANAGPQAGNVLYGLGGNLPAARLDLAGPLTAASLRQIPAQTLGYGQAQAAGVLGAGQQQARALDADVLAAQAKRATIATDYLLKLSEAARQAGQDRIANVFKALGLQQDQNAAAATAAWHDAQLQASSEKTAATLALQQQQGQSLDDYRQGTLGIRQAQAQGLNDYRQAQLQGLSDYRQGQLSLKKADAKTQAAYQQSYLAHLQAGDNERAAHNKALEAASHYAATTARINAQTSRQRATTQRAWTPNTTLSRSSGFVARVGPGGTTEYALDASGKRIPYKGTGSAAKGGIKLPSATQVGTLVQAWKTGKPVSVHVPQFDKGQPIKDINGAQVFKSESRLSGQLNFLPAYKKLRAMGLPDKQARQYLDTAYKRGEQGRAWLSNEEQYALRRAGRSTRPAIVNGHAVLMPPQVEALRKVNKLPPGTLTAEGALVIAQVY